MSWAFQKSGQPMVQSTTPHPGAGTQPLWQQMIRSAMTGMEALGGNQQFLASLMNPMWSQLGPFFDMLRGQAGQNAQAEATMGGGGGAAFDSTRAAAMKGAELAGVDNTMAQMKYADVNNTLSRALQMAAGVMGMGMGQDQSTPTNWSPLGALVGLAMTPFGGGTGIFGLHQPQAS